MINKLQHVIHKYHLDKWLNTIMFLIIIYLTYRIFTTPITSHEIISESFESFMPANVIYGNEIMPTYSTNQNTCSFSFPGVVRLDTIRIYLKNTITLQPTTAVTLQYIDPNGNTQNIVNDVNTMNTQITVGFDGVDKFIKIVPVLNTSGQPVYTNQIVLTVGSVSFANLDSYVKYYDFYGRNREDLTSDQFHSQLSTTAKNMSPATITTSNTITELSFDTDYLIYSMKLNLDNSTYPDFTQFSPDTPFALTIQYTTSIYPSQTLQISDSIITRCDSASFNVESPHIIYIYFSQPIIANKIVINAPVISMSSITATAPTPTVTIPPLQLIIKTTASLQSIYGTVPSANDITNFQRSAQTVSSGNSVGTSNDVCPSMNDMIQKQVQAQQLCDSIEIQDKIKAEQIRMDKNNQYLIKLKGQQDNIDQLNQAISQLQTTRSARDTSADMARVARYQNQKTSASTVRDIANQRLQSQDANNLNLNVTIK